jgi:hypothetical protein
VDLDGPRGFARIVEEIRTEGIGALGDFVDGSTLVAFGDKFEAIPDWAVGEGLKKGATEGRGDESGKGFYYGGGFGECPKEEGGGGKAAERVEIVQAKRSCGSKGEQAGANLHNSEFRSALFDFVGKDGFESGAAAEMDAKLRKIGKGIGKSDRSGFLLSGQIGFGPLFIEDGEGGALVANQIKGGRATDFLEGFAEELFFTVGGSF